MTCAFIASSGPFQLIQQNRMNICANYTFQHKEPNSEKKKNLMPSMASVHFRKYNYKWFIHSQGRASMSAVRATCPAGFDEPDPKSSKGMGLTCTDSCLPPQTRHVLKHGLCDQVGTHDTQLHFKTGTEG